MSSLLLSDDHLLLTLPIRRKLAGLLRDTVMPLTVVVSALSVPDGLATLRQLGLTRAPGLGVPRHRAIGTWRGAQGRTLVDVRRGAPAVLVNLTDPAASNPRGWRRLLVMVDDPTATAASISTAAARVRQVMA